MVESLGVLVPLSAVILSLGIPVIAIICGTILSIRRKNRETELRKAIIENNTDPESIKLLVKEPEKKSSTFTMLRWGCILLGAGLGALIPYLNGITDTGSLRFWLPIIAGMGCGMLIAFVIEYKLTKKNQQQKEPEQEA
ncbi:MAG: hypothetical protein IJL45_07185 [Prevotella sp.]|nr:hypothetical protein [Prevotella sp.]MBQ6186467.1 hypothetical protein [Prevotella sp.]